MIAFSLPPITLDIAGGDLVADTTDAVVYRTGSSVSKDGSGIAAAAQSRGCRALRCHEHT